jgi:hypothetical protein
MEFTDIFWILIVATTVLPAIRKKLLEWLRLTKLHQLEKKRNSRAITLLHRQETISFLGIPVWRHPDGSLPASFAETSFRAIHPGTASKWRRNAFVGRGSVAG